MATPKKTLDHETARLWSDLGHMVFIDALTSSAALLPKQFAFHGGTSLHLSWQSPRFSEDLDFLLARGLDKVMTSVLIPRIEGRMRAILKARDPLFDVEISDRTKARSNLLNYRVTVSHAGYLGNAKVKAEFWQVDPDYLQGYETRFAFPVKKGDVMSRVSQPLPAATLEAAYADKLTAFATRRHLKWRDVFDLWWIGSQVTIDVPVMAERFLHHVKAFDTVEDLPPAAALRRFLDRDPGEIAMEADPDLKRWLPKELWNSIEGSGVSEMVAFVRSSIERIASEIEIREAHLDEQDEPVGP